MSTQNGLSGSEIPVRPIPTRQRVPDYGQFRIPKPQAASAPPQDPQEVFPSAPAPLERECAAIRRPVAKCGKTIKNIDCTPLLARASKGVRNCPKRRQTLRIELPRELCKFQKRIDWRQRRHGLRLKSGTEFPEQVWHAPVPPVGPSVPHPVPKVKVEVVRRHTERYNERRNIKPVFVR